MSRPLNAHLFTRDFSALIQSSAWQVESCAWRLPGGPHTAELSAPANAAHLAAAADLLRCPLEIRGAGGTPLWWGYIESAGLVFGALEVERSLQGMATRLRAAGFEVNHGLEGGEPLLSAWAEDAAAIQQYGVMEAEALAGPVSAAQLDALRDLLLERLAQPQRRVTLREPGPPRLRLLARGWWAALGWRLAERPAGRVEHTIDSCGYQSLGADASCGMLSMPLTIPEGGWQAAQVGLRARKRGAPTDSLLAELCADNGGAPGTTLAVAQFQAGNLSNVERWVYAPLSPAPSLASGQTCWLVLSRGAAADAANHYRVKVDESGAFAGGALRLWSGTAWALRAPTADLNFRIAGGQPADAQIAVLADAQHGGQFLTGVELPDAPGHGSSPFRSGERTCLQEIEELLESGSADGQAYTAKITSDRRLVVGGVPAPETAVHRLGVDGVVRDAFGRPAQLENLPLGRWAALDAPWEAAGGPVLLRGARWDGKRVHWEV